MSSNQATRNPVLGDELRVCRSVIKVNLRGGGLLLEQDPTPYLERVSRESFWQNHILHTNCAKPVENTGELPSNTG